MALCWVCRWASFPGGGGTEQMHSGGVMCLILVLPKKAVHSVPLFFGLNAERSCQPLSDLTEPVVAEAG